jgi:hypothetical protein
MSLSFSESWSLLSSQWSPLHYTCLFGRKEAMKCLIEHHADVNKLTEGIMVCFSLSWKFSLVSESSFVIQTVSLLLTWRRTQKRGDPIRPFNLHRLVYFPLLCDTTYHRRSQGIQCPGL